MGDPWDTKTAGQTIPTVSRYRRTQFGFGHQTASRRSKANDLSLAKDLQAPFSDTMWNVAGDLRTGIRVLQKSPGFTAVAVLTLGVAIAANTTVFGWVDTVLLRPLPGVSEPGQLVAVEEISQEGKSLACPHPDFRDFQRQMRLISGVFASHMAPFTVGEMDQAHRVMGQTVSANMFAVLGVKAAIGRVFTPEEDRDSPGAFPIAVISDRLWRTQFHSDPQVVGKPVRINGHRLTVIGVTPAEFHGSFGGLALDVWVPLSMITQMGALNTWASEMRACRFLDIVARLKPGVTRAQANAEAQSVAARMRAAFPKSHGGVGVQVLPLWRAKSGAQSLLLDPLRILMAVAVLVLLIGCANVTNLLLARSITRYKEFGIRMAIGAGQWRLARQLLIETLLVALMGAALGIVISQWMSDSLMSLLPPTDLPVKAAFEGSSSPYSFNLNVMLFTMAVCLGAALFSTLLPSLLAGRVNVNESLKEGGRTGMTGVRSHRARGALVVFEVALASVSLIGAGLAIRAFDNARRMNPGFEMRNVLVAHLYLSSSGYQLDREKQFDRVLRDRLAVAPGIEEVTYADWVPLWFGESPYEMLRVEGDTRSERDYVPVSRTLTSPGYFHLMRIPLLAGRDFTAKDDRDSRYVAVVNQTFAERFFGGKDPIGRRILVSGDWMTVVGLAKDSKYFHPGESAQPYMYVPFKQYFFSGHNNFMFIRTAGNPNDVRPVLRREIAALDPSTALYDAMPLTEYTQAALYPQKVAASMLAALGILSMVLAAVGLYSVMAYAVSERTHEIGVRMALGARPRDVLAMVLRKGMILTVAGLLAGMAAALVATRATSGMFVTVSASEPLVFVAGSLLLTVVAILATYIPARRATKVDPVNALRTQ
jgi:predicted permease